MFRKIIDSDRGSNARRKLRDLESIRRSPGRCGDCSPDESRARWRDRANEMSFNCYWHATLGLAQYQRHFLHLCLYLARGPEDEADVDREIRIEKIERELEDLSGGSMT